MNFYTDFDCAIFDLDGTLIKSPEAWHQVDIDFMEERGLPLPPDFYERVGVMNLSQAADYVIAECGVTDPKEEVIACWVNMMKENYAHHIPEVEGASEFIRRLHGRGVKLCLATAAGKEFFEPCLKRLGIYDLFECRVTTEEVSRKKGFPDVYLLACERVGARPERSVVFEDILAGIKGAKMGNLTAVAILDECSASDHEEMRKIADLSIHDFREVM